ncbi:DUF3574 domain-containing protein [Streptomyces sp. NPDC004610]|uniref:DUF3574 domain-containing protein n=1 Tax=unclassified Streptomyces TaxID=2593676 RepID=UPI0033B06A69
MTLQPTRPRAALVTVAALLAVAAPTAATAAYATLDGSPGPTAPVPAAPGPTAPGSTTPVPAAPVRGEPFAETRLYFGTVRSGGPAVTDRQFLAFIDHEVTPSFPDGLTVQSGRGQWRDVTGTIVKERSYELLLLYPVTAAVTADRAIEEIRRDYEKRFGQESVGRVDDRVTADF